MDMQSLHQDRVTPLREDRDPLIEVAQRYVVKTTPFLERLMEGVAPDDPIVRQFRPTPAELTVLPEEQIDPIADQAKSPLPGIVHRYPDRVLLKPIHVCAAYCRFCFRRDMVGPDSEHLTDAQLDDALAYIRSHPAIWEVVMTGGDPLLLSPRRLRRIVDALEDIPHVAVLRVHSRLPVHDPGRVSPELIAPLAGVKRMAVWVAVHVNHAREFAPEVAAALAFFVRAGIPLLSQSVLLKGVNADIESLENLFRACVAHKIKPYYLHHPDLARGTSHFRLSIEEGRALVQALWGRLSGLALPTYVFDRPGGIGKVPVGPQWPTDWNKRVD